MTGETWIDGKPIYRKVVGLGHLPNNNISEVAHGVVGATNVIKVYGVGKFTASSGITVIPIPRVASGSFVDMYFAPTKLIIQTNANYSDYNGYAIIEYTK